MRSYLIPHAKPATLWGDGDDDPGLDDLGWQQAYALGQSLARLPESVRPTWVVSSPFRRCRETAKPLADQLGVTIEIDDAVGEIPTPSSLQSSERAAWLLGVFSGNWSDIDGDQDYDLWRHRAALSISTKPRAAIFSHFVAINAIVSVIRSDKRVINFRPDHTSLTTLRIDNGSVSLITLGGEAVTRIL